MAKYPIKFKEDYLDYYRRAIKANGSPKTFGTWLEDHPTWQKLKRKKAVKGLSLSTQRQIETLPKQLSADISDLLSGERRKKMLRRKK